MKPHHTITVEDFATEPPMTLQLAFSSYELKRLEAVLHIDKEWKSGRFEFVVSRKPEGWDKYTQVYVGESLNAAVNAYNEIVTR